MKILSITVLFLFLMLSCKEKIEENDINFYFEIEQSEDILAQVISYVYSRPKEVSSENRFNPEFRSFYKKELRNFEILHFFQNKEDGFYYYYLLRPARNIHENKRGVAGKFQLDSSSTIINFEEVLVTKMIEEQKVIDFGMLIFEEFSEKKGEIKMTPLREDLIEFPDERTYYNTDSYEWLYKPSI